jgi:hypothetical protein
MSMRLGVIFMLLVVIGLQGCGGSDKAPTYTVTGTVTYGGTPIEAGSIVFDPVDGQGQAAMGGIVNGQFTAEVQAGKKVIRISAVRKTGEKDQYGEFITESYIPEKYGPESVIERTVERNDENTFDFALD